MRRRPEFRIGTEAQRTAAILMIDSIARRFPALLDDSDDEVNGGNLVEHVAWYFSQYPELKRKVKSWRTHETK